MIIKIKKEANYTAVSNEAILDKQLSYKAKGVWLYLMSKPEHWVASVPEIMKHGKEGRDAIYKAIDELINAGYAERKEMRYKGKIDGYELIVYEQPLTEKPYTANPDTAKPYTANQTLVNTDTSKDLNKVKTDNIPKVNGSEMVEVDALLIAESLAEHIKKNYDFVKVDDKKIQAWAKDIEKLHRIDGYDYKLIQAVIDWACEDDFWKQNIRSGAKLRKQFETLLVRIKSTPKKMEFIS